MCTCMKVIVIIIFSYNNSSLDTLCYDRGPSFLILSWVRSGCHMSTVRSRPGSEPVYHSSCSNDSSTMAI